MYACINAATAASYDQGKFMKGWFDGQVLDFIHDNAAIIDENEIDQVIGENGGHKFGCYNHGPGYSDKMQRKKPTYVAAASPLTGASSGSARNLYRG